MKTTIDAMLFAMSRVIIIQNCVSQSDSTISICNDIHAFHWTFQLVLHSEKKNRFIRSFVFVLFIRLLFCVLFGDCTRRALLKRIHSIEHSVHSTHTNAQILIKINNNIRCLANEIRFRIKRNVVEFELWATTTIRNTQQS